MELTLRTPAALDALKRVKTEVPQMVLGAGTVLDAQQVNAVINAGVDFAVSPGLDPDGRPCRACLLACRSPPV